MGCTISTMGPRGKDSVFFPRSTTQQAARSKSRPNRQGSCTTATHTLKFINSPPTCTSTTPLPSIGASSPVTVRRFTAVGCNCIPSGTTSGLISVAVEPVSTSAMHGVPARVMGTWQKPPTWVQPAADSAVSFGGKWSPAPLSVQSGPVLRRQGMMGTGARVYVVPSTQTPGCFPEHQPAWGTAR